MSKEKPQNEIEWLESLRNLSPEQKERYPEQKWKDGRKQGRPLMGKRAKPAESRVDEKPSGNNIPNVAPLFHEAFKKYGEPTMTLDELREEMAKEFGGKSLSDLVIEERRKKPY